MVSPMATPVYCSTISVMTTISKFSCTPLEFTSWDANAICMNVKCSTVHSQKGIDHHFCSNWYFCNRVK